MRIARGMLLMASSRAVLSPHLDDAVFSCWHVLAGPGAVEVVTVFAGIPDEGTPLPRWDRITGAHNSAERVRERLAEDREALALAGREGTYLHFVERQYGAEHPSVEEVVLALRERVSAGSEVFAPAGIGDHSAHVLTRQAALELAGEGRKARFYADLPYATEFGWPAWVTGDEPDPYRDVDAAWRADAEPLFEAGYRPQAVTLSDELRAQKAEALTKYRSQLSALDGGPQRRLTHPALLRYEVVWSL
jgi:LmbE family N-acetylglucosaminyl deacetylase